MTLVILKQSYKTVFGCLTYKETKHQLQVEKKKKIPPSNLISKKNKLQYNPGLLSSP